MIFRCKIRYARSYSPSENWRGGGNYRGRKTRKLILTKALIFYGTLLSILSWLPSFIFLKRIWSKFIDRQNQKVFSLVIYYVRNKPSSLYTCIYWFCQHLTGNVIIHLFFLSFFSCLWIYIVRFMKHILHFSNISFHRLFRALLIKFKTICQRVISAVV